MRIGISYRLSLVVLLVVLALGGALGAFFAVEQSRALGIELDRRIDLLGAHLSASVAHSLAEGDIHRLNDLVRGTAIDPEIAYLLVKSNDGEIIAARWVNHTAGSVAEYGFPLRVAGDANGEFDLFGAAGGTSARAPSGSIAIGVDLAPLAVSRRRLFARTGAGVLIAALLAALLGVGVVRALLRRSVTPLVEGIRGIASGDLSRRVHLSQRDDELLEIGRAFNDMAERLSTTLVSKRELEGTVAERTSELTDTLGELLRANQALSDREARVRLLLDSTAEAIYGIDLAGVCTFCNPACLRLLGWARTEDLVGRNMHELVHRADADGSPIPQADCRIHGRPPGLGGHHSAYEVYSRADGTSLPVECWSFPIVRQGERVGSVVTFLDVTDRRKLADAMLEMKKLESLGVLAGGIAHDFNNMLTGILGSISLAKEVLATPQEARPLLEEAEAAALRTKGLTKQLLTFSKGGAPVKKVLSIREVVEQAARFALSGSAARSACTFASDLWPVEADAGQIGQVVHNLVTNAVQAMGGAGTVAVSAENVELRGDEATSLPEGRYVKVSVADRGVGIPPENLSRVFDPYFTTKKGGSGLGLATVYSIVKGHGGRVTVVSDPGKGATFEVALPASERAAAPEPEQPPLAATRGGRVLVMDDDAAIRRLATAILSSRGYEVVCAADGEEAVETFLQAKGAGRPFDLLVMDLTVPGQMGGEEAFRRIRAADAEVRALVSSGYSDDLAMARHREMGFVGIVPKPYTPSELARAVAEALR